MVSTVLRRVHGGRAVGEGLHRRGGSPGRRKAIDHEPITRKLSEITSGARLKERFGMSEAGPDSLWPDETVRHNGFSAAAVNLVDPPSAHLRHGGLELNVISAFDVSDIVRRVFQG
ncbi:hypothetical protein MTO96_000399 [Rhipicephalus appendiculatus]